MGRFCKIYEPVSSVTALRLAPVAVCVAVTSTPGRTAPVWSFTEPMIWAVACAHSIVVGNDKNRSPASTVAVMLIDFRLIDFLPQREAWIPFLIVFFRF